MANAKPKKTVAPKAGQATPQPAVDTDKAKNSKNPTLSEMVGELLSRSDEKIGNFLTELSAGSKKAIAKLHKEVTAKKPGKSGKTAKESKEQDSFTKINNLLTSLSKEAGEPQKAQLKELRKEVKKLHEESCKSKGLLNDIAAKFNK